MKLKLKHRDLWNIDMGVGNEEGSDEVDTPDGEIGPDTSSSLWYLVPFLRMMKTDLGGCW